MEKLKVRFQFVCSFFQLFSSVVSVFEFSSFCVAEISLACPIEMRAAYAVQHKINSFHERIKLMVARPSNCMARHHMNESLLKYSFGLKFHSL